MNSSKDKQIPLIKNKAVILLTELITNYNNVLKISANVFFHKKTTAFSFLNSQITTICDDIWSHCTFKFVFLFGESCFSCLTLSDGFE
jgi:Leucine-rich repeat (LRR) protein